MRVQSFGFMAEGAVQGSQGCVVPFWGEPLSLQGALQSQKGAICPRTEGF